MKSTLASSLAATDRRGIHSEVVELLGSDIASGHRPEGSILGNQGPLADRLGVSRTVLREALKVLGEKGMVLSRPKVGTRVLPRSEWNLVDRDVLRWIIEAGDDVELFRQVSEVRSMIEPAAARLAAERRTATEAAALLQAMDDLEASADDDRRYVLADRAFHALILQLTHNQLLEQMTAAISVALEAGFRVGVKSPGGAQASMGSHRIIAEAIASGDGAAAEAEMRSLVLDAITGIQEVFSAIRQEPKTEKRGTRDE